MSDSIEIKVWQKRGLFKLLKLQKTVQSSELKELIVETEAEMEQEDVAWVAKKITEL